MSMTPNLYTISGLAVEWGKDRRTVARKISNVQPAEVKGKVKYYRLADVADLLADQKRTNNSASTSDDEWAGFIPIVTNSVAALTLLEILEGCKEKLSGSLVSDLVSAYVEAILLDKHLALFGSNRAIAELARLPIGRGYPKPVLSLPKWVVGSLTPETKRKITISSPESV